MAIKILNQIVNGVKGEDTGALKGTADVGSTIVNSVKDIAVTTIKGAGELVVKGIQVPASIVKGAIDEPPPKRPKLQIFIVLAPNPLKGNR